MEFYQNLQFEVISESSPTLVTDGKALIEINADRTARAGIKLFADNWAETLTELENYTEIMPIDDGYLLSDPSGTRIYLILGEPPYTFSESKEAFSILGNYAGISLETTDISRSIAIWKAIGFNKITGTIEQGWISCQNDDQVAVSIMKPNICPHLFFNPSLTYFNGQNNLAVIERIRTLNIAISEEITTFNKEGKVDNIIIRDPGGYGFFVFND